MGKGNNIIPNGHFHKKWFDHVQTWFDQPGRKKSRRLARQAKATRIAPRPVAGPLRPAVHCPTQQYNRKLRAGRGFTLEELKEAGIRRKEALTLGVAVDHRRRNKSLESLQLNVQRLKLYKSKLIVFPRKAKKPKKGDSTAAEVATAAQLTGPLLPITQETKRVKARAITDADRAVSAYTTVRKIRSDHKQAHARAKRRAEKEQNDVASAKKESKKAAKSGDDDAE
jgi:large subunit ribosomal protein L13e